MEFIFLTLLNMSISASWLIAAVVILRFCLKKAPKWIPCALWTMVGVRLICPYSLESIFSLVPSAETISPYAVQFAREPELNSGVPLINHVLNPIIRESFTPAPGASANPLHIWMLIAGLIWAAGLAVLVGYALFGYLRMRHRVREAVLLRDNIWLCDAVKSPFILGVFKPRIYLSSSTAETHLEYVLAHEQTHLARKDNWWKPLGYLLLAVHWFNPLVWAAYALFCRDIELACDEQVIKGLSMDQKKAYSHALLACSTQKSMVMACPLAFGEVDVKERVSTVLSYKKPAFWVRAGAVILCAAVALCFLTNPKAHAEEPGPRTGGIDYSEYDALIAQARDVLMHFDGTYPEEIRFSSVFFQNWDYETLGYLLRDLDGDGVDELIFGENADWEWNGIVYDIYTLRDGQLVHVLDGWERSRYYLCENGCIAHEGSSGAFEGSYSYYQYQDGALTLVEAVTTTYDSIRDTWVYLATSQADPENPVPISREQASAMMEQYVYEYPTFTPFVTEH